jgi:hypothetical protein
MSADAIKESIVSLERAALDRWCKGDPYGFVDNSLDEVTYFDVTTDRVDGLAALKQHVLQFVGKIDVPRYAMPNVNLFPTGRPTPAAACSPLDGMRPRCSFGQKGSGDTRISIGPRLRRDSMTAGPERLARRHT